MPFFRLCWTEEVRARNGDSETCTEWVSDDGASLEALDSFEAMLKAGNERFGSGSHWIERRQMDEPDAR